MNSTIDKILVGILLLNALINGYLLTKDNLKNKGQSTSNQGDSRFFRLYMMIVPFFITKNILMEIEEKRNKSKNKTPKNQI